MTAAAGTKRSFTKRIATDSMLLAVAIAVFVIEAQIPFIVSFPGIKLGIANVVTLYSMYRIGKGDTLIIMFLRILIAGIYTGQIVSVLFSAGGGICCFCAMLIAVRFIPAGQAWVTGVIAAIAHNLGQAAVAVFITGSSAVLLYLPVLIIAAILTGTATGLISQGILIRTEKIIKHSR